MGLIDSLFRRNKGEKGVNTDALFSIVTAQVNLAAQYGMYSLGAVGVCFNPMDSSFFNALETEVKGILSVGERTAGTRYAVLDDEYGARWVILKDDNFEDLTTGAYMVAQSFSDHGFAGRLLAAVFPFEYENQEIQWIYNYKRGNFYPFVPITGKQQRDNGLELSLSAKVKGDFPIESELGRWYALWGAPFNKLSRTA